MLNCTERQSALPTDAQVSASVRCRRCSGRRPRTRRSGRHRGRSAWPLGGWRPRCRTARCLLCERRGALPLGLRLLGVLPRLASRAQRALRARVVPAAVLIVPATPECAFLYLKSRLSRRYLKATLELTLLRAGKPCFCDTKGTPRIILLKSLGSDVLICQYLLDPQN